MSKVLSSDKLCNVQVKSHYDAEDHVSVGNPTARGLVEAKSKVIVPSKLAQFCKVNVEEQGGLKMPILQRPWKFGTLPSYIFMSTHCVEIV